MRVHPATLPSCTPCCSVAVLQQRQPRPQRRCGDPVDQARRRAHLLRPRIVHYRCRCRHTCGVPRRSRARNRHLLLRGARLRDCPRDCHPDFSDHLLRHRRPQPTWGILMRTRNSHPRRHHRRPLAVLQGHRRLLRHLALPVRDRPLHRQNCGSRGPSSLEWVHCRTDTLLIHWYRSNSHHLP